MIVPCTRVANSNNNFNYNSQLEYQESFSAFDAYIRMRFAKFAYFNFKVTRTRANVLERSWVERETGRGRLWRWNNCAIVEGQRFKIILVKQKHNLNSDFEVITKRHHKKLSFLDILAKCFLLALNSFWMGNWRGIQMLIRETSQVCLWTCNKLIAVNCFQIQLASTSKCDPTGRRIPVATDRNKYLNRNGLLFCGSLLRRHY